MNNETPNDNKSAAEYLLNWAKAVRKERLLNPEVFINKEPGFYIGGIKYKDGDVIVTDNHGLPHIIRAGCCE